MKKTLISVILVGLLIILTVWLVIGSCERRKERDEKDGPGYIPPDLTYETDDPIGENGTERPETDVPEESEGTQPWGEDQPQTGDRETKAPEADNPETKEPETNPAEITPPDTTPIETTLVLETTPPETDDDWFDPAGPEDETKAPETELPYYPDPAPIPTEVKYLMLQSSSFRDFVISPSEDVFENGYNRYTIADNGTVHMRQVTSSGFERYVGEYSGGNMDLSLDVINFVTSGELQDLLIANKVNNTIIELCAVARGDAFTKQTVLWLKTKDGHYFVTYDSNADDGESAFKLYTHKEYLKLID